METPTWRGCWLGSSMIYLPSPERNSAWASTRFIGLIPGLGDSSSTAVASLLLVQALRAGVPKVVITRMALNILINAGIGAIPGIGDVFSAMYKSNRKNYQLLQRHAGSSRKNTTGDWIFLGAIIALVIGTGLLITFTALSS